VSEAETRSIAQHLEELVAQGRVAAADGVYRLA
jgi:hypothetical protein